MVHPCITQAPSFDILKATPPATVLPLMPRATGFSIFTAHCTAEGGGTQTRRGLMDCLYLATCNQAAIAAILRYPPAGLPLNAHTLGQRTLDELQAAD